MSTASGLHGSWKRLPLPHLPRSSHTLSLQKPATAVLFSGELQPREPVSNVVYLVDLSVVSNTSSDLIRIINPDASTSEPRVGSASASLDSKTYIFSGRAGKDFSPLSSTLYEFSTDTDTWRAVEVATDSAFPEPRSYHALTAAGATIYLHAGCSASGGRLNDLWSFDTKTETWTPLADAPGSPRGGTSLVASKDKTRLYRIGGFDGKMEIGGSLDIYDIAHNSWTSLPYEGGPIARSVAALVSARVTGKEYLIYLFGEADPSTIGHAGAGKFLEDTWAFDIEGSRWTEVKQKGDSPVARGWLDAVDWEDDKILVQGGLGENNDRLGDWWILQLET